MNVSPLLTVNIPCSDALQWAKNQFGKSKLRTVQTFDLNHARTGTSGCVCPDHGTDACDCTMMVLLIYGETPEPVTLFLHGNGRRSWFSIAEDSRQQADKNITDLIRRALDIKAHTSV